MTEHNDISAPAQAKVPDTKIAIRPERFFAVMSLLAGIFYAFVTPPFRSPDEEAHFCRAYQLSEGTIIAERRGDVTGGRLPVSLSEASMPFVSKDKENFKAEPALVLKVLRQPFAQEPRAFYEFIHTALYSPVAYAPAAIAIAFFRWFGFSALAMLYAARVATLLSWTLLIIAAIRTSPFFKWVIVLLALMPMSVFLAATPSADVITNGLSILIVAYIMKLAMHKNEAVLPHQWICLIIISVLLALTKPLYFLLAGAVLVIPVSRFGGWKRKLLISITVLMATIIVALVWGMAVRGIVVTEEWAQPAAQIRFMFEQPFEFIFVLGATLAKWWSIYIKWFVGVLGWLDIWLPWWVYPTYILMMIVAALVDGNENIKLWWGAKVFLAVLCTTILLTIAISQYITYTQPMAETIRGIQGRYAIPLALPVLLILHNRILRQQSRRLSVIVSVFCGIVLAATAWSILRTCYL